MLGPPGSCEAKPQHIGLHGRRDEMLRRAEVLADGAGYNADERFAPETRLAAPVNVSTWFLSVPFYDRVLRRAVCDHLLSLGSKQPP